MRRVLTAIATLALFSAVEAEAPCLASCRLCGEFEVGTQALAFVPLVCAYDYATTNAPIGAQSVASLSCDLDWGFRVFGRYLSDCSFAHISYQWYESTVTHRVGTPFTNFRGGFVALAGSAQLHLEYQNVDVRVGTTLHHRPTCRFTLFGNVRWIDLHYRRSVRPDNGMGTIQLLNEKSDFEGAAVGLGAGSEIDLSLCWQLFGELNLLGAFAQHSSTDVRTNNAGDYEPINYETDDCFTPEATWRLGIRYGRRCGCIQIQGELGYELDYFWNALLLPSNQTEGRRNLEGRFRNCEDIGFAGLFAGLRLLF